LATSEGRSFSDYTHVIDWIYIFPLTVVASVKGNYFRFGDQLYFLSKRP